MRIKPWNIDWTLRNTFLKITGRKSLSAEREERITLLREMLYPGESKPLRPSLSKDYFGKLSQDFALSSVSLANRDGEMIASSGRNDITIEQDVFSSVTKSIPDTKYLLIKGENKTHVIYPDNGSLLVVEAAGNVSPVEMKVLLRKVKKGESA